MVSATKSVKDFATIAFTLLGILFGMMIMTFIFGLLGPSSSGLTISDPGFNESLTVQNNSLQAIVSYTGQSDTQMLTVAIAITLVVLIAVFLLFWTVFIKGGKKEGSGGTFN